MKKFLLNFKLEKIKESLVGVCNRFPLAVIIIVFTAIGFFSLLHSDLSDILESNVIIGILSCIMTFFLSIGVDLNSESRKFVGTKKYLYQLIPIVFGIFFFATFNSDIDNFENMVFFFLSLCGIMGFLFFAPYVKNIINRDGKQNIYYSYFYKISTLFLISFILGGALFAGGSIAIATVETLFGLGIYDKIYGDWAIIALCIFTPVFALSEIPNKTQFNKAVLSQNNFFSFLTKYVAVPFVILYFLILYAYSIKVLLTFGNWPKGEVSWMVIGFSILGYITYIFSYSLEAKNKLILTFRKYFPYAVVPQVFMLFYAIYLRIAQYDVTINRYFVVVFGIWLLTLSIYYIISNKKYLAYIPAILTLFTIIISLGPWSVYSLPESRQLSRLENNLQQANILKNNSIIPLENYSDIDEKLSGEIYNGIDYLCDFSNCESIKKLFPKQYEAIVINDKKEFDERIESDLEFYKNNPDYNYKIENIENRRYEGPNKWTIVSKLTETLKVKSYNSYNYNNTQRPYKSFYIDYNNNHFPIDTTGYGKMLRLNDTNYQNPNLHAIINIDSREIYIKDNYEIQETINVSDIFNQLAELDGNNQSLKAFELTFEIGEDYKVFFENIDIPNPDYTPENNQSQARPYNSGNGYLLVK